MEGDAAVASLARIPCAAAGGGAVSRHLGKGRDLGGGRQSGSGGGLSSRPAVTPSRGPEPVGSPSPTPYQSCPNSFYGLPSAVLTVLPLLRRQNLAMGGSTRKLGAETLRRPWRGPPRGGTGRDPCGAGYRMLGVRDGDRLSRVEVSGSVVSALCFVCPKSLLSARRLYEAAGCGLYCSLNIARGSALATNPED